MEEARKKIEAEMAAHAANTPLQRIGSFLLQHLQSNPGAAPAIMTNDKTLMGSLNAMRDEARKHHQHGGIAVLTDEEGFNMVLGYFGITAPAAPASASAKAFDTSDLLAGL